MANFEWLNDKSKYSNPSASAVYNNNTPASKAFDGNVSALNTDGWRTLSNVNNAWIQVQLDKARIVTKIRIDSTFTGREPKQFNLLAGTDFSSMEIIGNFLIEEWTNTFVELDVNVDNKNYSHFRLEIQSSTTNSGIFISEITFGQLSPSKNVLFLKNGEYKKYDFSTNQWITITNNVPTYDDYVQGNTIQELNNIGENQLISLDDTFDFELVYYTENNTGDCLFELEVEPFSVYDYISENPQVMVYTELIGDRLILTETEPYTFYDEFEDEIEVLYYTDDETVTEADLIIEANHSPLDELEGDFKVVTWQEEYEDLNLKVEGIRDVTPTTVRANGDISLYNVFEIESVNLVASGDGKVTVSTDRGVTWLTFNGVEWVQVSEESDGLTFNEFNSLTTEQLSKLITESEALRFAYYITEDTEIDNIQMRVSMSGTEKLAETSDYTYRYDKNSKTIIYNINKSGTYSVNYLDAIQ